MADMSAAQFEQELRNSGGGIMDTSPIAPPLQQDMASFMTSLSPIHPDPALQNQLLQDSVPVFMNKPELPNGMVAPMHISMPDLTNSAFMTMEAADPVGQLHTAPPAFLADLSQTDPFAMMTAPDGSMNLEMSPAHSISPPQSQVPSPSIHGIASSYSAGVTSSLESALDPSGVTGSRSRANTSVSPTTLPSSFPPASPPSVQFPNANSVVMQEKVPSNEPHLVIGELLKDIAKTANSAGDAYRNRHAEEANYKVDQLKERISHVSRMITLMSLGSNDYSSSFSSQQAPVPIAEPHPIAGFSSVGSSSALPVDLSGHLNVADHSRKRCASVLEEQRTVKAPKREPQEDPPLTFSAIDTPVPLPVETSSLFAGVPLPNTATRPLVVPSQPPSRPPSPPPPSTFRDPFGTVKQQTPVVSNFSQFIPTAPVPLDFTSSIPPPLATASPTFPALHTAWTDTVIPTSRHHHSSSLGSINSPLSGLPILSSADAFPSPTIPQMPSQAIPITSVASVSQPIGRMSRSGSINGAPLTAFGKHSHNYSYMDSFPDQTVSENWPAAGRVPNTAPPQPSHTTWYVGSADPSGSSASPPSDEEGEDDDGDSDDNDPGGHPKTMVRTPSNDGPMPSSSGSDVPQEYRNEVDRIFFEYLNRICSNLEATDSKGEPIHQTLMAKKMQRLDESPDFRPFKFRIQAFTLAFLEELARQGYPEEKIPMKKIRNYLWRQQYILRFNEDGKKAKSKGNHIWNIEAKKAGDGKWEFRPFHRKLAGTPPGVAYCGLKWSWTPRIWDPQASWQNVPVQYSSPNLPPWLSWKEDVLSGVPPPDAESCDITVNAKFVLDGQEGHLSQKFRLTVAPVSTLENTNFSRSRRPSLAGEPPKRSSSDSALFQYQRTQPRGTTDDADKRVKRVLQSVAQRVTEEAEDKFRVVSTSPPKRSELQDLVKQKHVLEQTVNAYDQEISGHGHAQTRQLAVAAQNIVVQAAHTVIADRTIATGVLPARQPETVDEALQDVSVNELTNATQGAIAMAVKSQGTASTEVDIIVAATSILRARAPTIDAVAPPVMPQQVRSHSMGTVPSMLGSNMVAGYPTSLSTLPEYV
ncbi:hypothetical protein BDQ12DRAFT_676183 [Crucibulum laeve]|uniref:Uncharacterized protein n=1 Tax=Crucibulum laeve TaxID=68775 RepID=A0A5C3MCN5_9AGAR|nr:hypothetical protein BDQ12DRAFT_676183 [Crucibulum laeve]